MRSYGVPQEDGKVFVELKKKFDGVVYKRRITTGIQNMEPFLSGELPSENFGQIGREIGYFQSFYHTTPKVFIGYDRLAFAGIDDPQLRITFDTNLRWRDTDVDLRLGNHGAPIALPCGDVLMEVKIPGACRRGCCTLLSDVGAFSASFSKYGACYRDELSAGVHTTNFKGRIPSVLNSILGSELTLVSFLICTAVSLLLGVGTALVSMYRSRTTQSFAVTLAILPAVVQLVIMLVNGNLGAGVAVAGAFGLVRFRSAPGTAKEIGALFLAMAIGLATGMGYVWLAVMAL